MTEVDPMYSSKARRLGVLVLVATAFVSASPAIEGVLGMIGGPEPVPAFPLRHVRRHAANLAPDCGRAAPTVAVLRNANGRFQRIAVTGVSDADGDPVTIFVSGVRQDEPPEARRIGSPFDARGTAVGSFELRSASAGGGDGRVYHASFTAADDHGASCSGEVRICVPRDGSGDSCGDQGALYSSVARG